MEDFFESLKRQSLQQTLIDTQRTLIDTLVTEFRSDQSKLHQWPNTLSAIPCTFNTSVNTTPSFKSLSLNQTNKSKGGESSNTSNSPKIPAKETEFYPSSIATWRTTEDLKKCYLEDHNIQSFFEEVTTALVKENPENPFQFIADKFKAQADEYQKYLTEKKLKRREQREITLASARKFPIGTSLHQIELTKSIDSCKSYEERRELIHQILFQSRKPQQILSQIPIDKDFLECLQYCDFISVLHTRTIVLLIPMEKYFFLEDITLLLSAVDPERLDQSLFRTDERLRILFAQDRMNLDIQDPHVNCLDITTSSQYCRLEDPPPIPLVCNFATISDFDKFNPPHSIVSLESFKKRFHWFSSGCLGNLSWKGIFVAGGCVSACLKYYPELENCESVQIEQARFTDLHLRLYKESDIDIFFYDMSSEEANQKLIAISKLFSDDEILIVRTNSAVTFCCQYPRRHVQVVLRIYKSPAEVLHCFDLVEFHEENFLNGCEILN